MKMMDPTYLRTIHDGLLSGAVHKDNASALPLGLVGLYEKELPPASNVGDRKKFLDFFTVWALLKKEVSVAFVLPMLEGWTEEQVVDYIAKYSKWFNSPVSGKYVLYHERLRTFILQKVADKQFAKCNESVIAECQNSLQKKAGDEWEQYALEHLSTHLLIEAMESQDGSDLKALAYHSGHWNRQIEISKNFKWSKNLLNDMMFWASKYDEDEVIECALNKVDLYHLEQNDAPRIVELVAQNDLETALQRMESFGGNDKEGLQRKFILYMLCLMELTLLESKDKPFRKEAIEKLLKHLDDNLPVDHSILKWNDFFPSYLMFQMACELADLNLEYILLYKFTNINRIELDWVQSIQTISSTGVRLLIEIISGIADAQVKDKFLNLVNRIAQSPNEKMILNESRSLCEEKEPIQVLTSEELILLKFEVDRIEDAYDKVLAMIELGYKMFDKEAGIEINNYKREIIDTINKIEEDDMMLKSYSYSDLAGLLNNFGDVKGSIECLFHAMAVIPFINVFERHEAYMAIGKEIIQECKCYLLDFIHRHVLETAHELADDWFDYIGTTQEEMIKSVLFDLKHVCHFNKVEDIILNQNYLDRLELFNSFVFTPLSFKGDLKNVKTSFLKSISINVGLDEKIRNKDLKEMACCFIAQEQFNKAISIATSINEPYITTEVLFRIAVEKITNEEIDFVDSLAKNIIFNDERFEFYGKIVEHLISIEYDVNRVKYYLERMCDLISTKLNSDNFLKKLIGLYEEIHEYTYAYNLSNKIWDVDDKRIYRYHILRSFGKNNNLVYAIEFAKKITDLTHRSIAMESIANELQRQGKLEESNECLKDIGIDSANVPIVASIVDQKSIQEKSKNSFEYLMEMLNFEDLKKASIKDIFGELENLNYYLGDLKTLKLVLNKIAIIQLFSENLSEEGVHHLNRTLNIQWAIDIKNSMNVN